MMKRIYLLVTILFVALTIQAQTSWVVDKANSNLNFSVFHMGISDVTGRFNDFDVTLTADDEDFADAVLTLSVDVASIDTGIKMRDDHLRTDDFFDVEKYPKMTFHSTSIEKLENGLYALNGQLTLHGITKEVSMKMRYRGVVVNKEKGTAKAGFKITGSIMRKDFGVGGESTFSVSNEVKIVANGEFTRK